MSRNVSKALARQIGRAVYAKQSGRAKGLKGKFVERAGTTFYVIEVKDGQVTLHAVGAPKNVTTKHNLKSFLSKMVRIVDPPGRGPKQEDVAITTADVAASYRGMSRKRRKRLRWLAMKYMADYTKEVLG
jgi:hypothetical protein